MKLYLSIIAFLAVLTVQAQVTNIDSLTNEPLNSVNNIIKGNSGKNITVGGYAQIDYNQPVGGSVNNNGVLDVHRFVLFMGYKFNDRTHFVTELEFEHVTEVYVEQAFINYRFNPTFNFRAGLMLVPMGIINEYHEPTTFNGVERPALDSKIVPTTWRELGLGLSGNIQGASLKYQLYMMNGFNGFDDGGGKFRGSDGFRKGRQKGAKSYISTPTLSTKVDYYGLPGLKIGLAGYFGKSQSKLYDGLHEGDDAAVAQADSSIVNIAMIGLDARYQLGGFTARAQLINTTIGNTDQYNGLTGRDLGSRMFGYYLEAGYDILRLMHINNGKQLTLFVRYEKYDTHASVEENIIANAAYDRTDVTMGATLKLAPGAALKVDYQILQNGESATDPTNRFNAGVGIWF